MGATCTTNPRSGQPQTRKRAGPHVALVFSPRFYQQKRDRFAALLGDTRFELLPVAGAYFQIVDYGAISEDDDRTFCEWLVRHRGVAAIPLSAFYETPPKSRLIRFCFAKTETTLAAAAARLAGL